MVKKVFVVYTKDNRLLWDLQYHVYAKDIRNAIVKVLDSIEEERYIEKVEYLCDLDEDEDLIAYKKERVEDQKSIKN